MSLPIYQRVAVTDAGDIIPGAEYTVINENTGVAAPIYSDRTGATLLTAPYFADSAGTIQFFIAQGTTFRVAASGGVGTYTDRYVYGVAEAVLVQANGNVGIGTNSASSALEVVGGSSLGSGFTQSRSGHPTFGITNGGTDSVYFSIAPDGGPQQAFMQVRDDNTDVDSIAFSTSGSERVRIDSAGNLLVGKTAFSISTTGVVLRPTGSMWGTASNDVAAELNRLNSIGEIVRFRNDGAVVGSIGSYGGELVVSSPAGGDCAFRVGYNAIKPATVTGANADGVHNLGETSGRWKDLYLSGASYNGSSPTSSAAGVLTESAGRATYSRGSGTGGYAHLAFINGNGTVGAVISSGSSTSYATSSDYRLKEDDVPMTGATERVKALRPINFAWKADGSRVDGFFAHELAEVVPEAATGTKDAMMEEDYEVTPAAYEDVITPAVEAVLDEDGVVITEAVEESTESVLVTEAVMGTRSVPDYQGIDQSKLVPLLTATIQELIARIEALESGA